MLYLLFLLAEILFLLAICLPCAVFAPPELALPVIVILLLLAVFVRPARRLSLFFKFRSRHVARRFRAKPVPDNITLRPSNAGKGLALTPAEVFRLMEIIGVIPRDRAPVADFTATLLDLNHRGLLSLCMTDEDTLLRADGMRIVLRHDLDTKKLTPHEARFIRLLRRAVGSASSIPLSAFADFVSRTTARAHRDTEAFRRAVDRALTDKKCIGYVREKKKPGAYFSHRVRVLSRRGEQTAALWRVYLKNICTHPFLDSYSPHPGEAQKPFAKEAAQLLIDAAACGQCARAAEALMREYLFEPMDLYGETEYFSSLTETRCAFAGTESGESYFFLPLRKFETAIRCAVLYGTNEDIPLSDDL